MPDPDGYSMGSYIHTQFFNGGFNQAKATRGRAFFLTTIFYSRDHGYTVHEQGLQGSLGTLSDATVNGKCRRLPRQRMTESLWASLKKSRFMKCSFSMRDKTRLEIFYWIHFYNQNNGTRAWLYFADSIRTSCCSRGGIVKRVPCPIW